MFTVESGAGTALAATPEGSAVWGARTRSEKERRQLRVAELLVELRGPASVERMVAAEFKCSVETVRKDVRAIGRRVLAQRWQTIDMDRYIAVERLGMLSEEARAAKQYKAVAMFESLRLRTLGLFEAAPMPTSEVIGSFADLARSAARAQEQIRNVEASVLPSGDGPDRCSSVADPV